VTAVRDSVMISGRCSFCGRPAEQHAISRRWWHTAESCKPAYAITHAGEIPAGRLGWQARWQARWPARFEQEPPIKFELELYRPPATHLYGEHR
jgi:hypothetical protein